MAKVNIGTAINTLMVGSADQKQIGTILNALVDDIELNRAAMAALNTKLDANHAAATDHAATITVPKSALSVSK